MSNYKLIEVIKTSAKEEQSLYDREDLNTALADMMNYFGVAVKADTTLSVYCVVINQETGERVDGKYWRGSDVVTEEGTPIDYSIRQRVYTHNDYADDNILAYDSERLAIGNFYTRAASSMKKAECNFALTIRLDNQGGFVSREVFIRPQEEPETPEESDESVET